MTKGTGNLVAAISSIEETAAYARENHKVESKLQINLCQKRNYTHKIELFPIKSCKMKY